MLKPGLYEQVINNRIRTIIDNDPELRSFTASIDQAEAPKVLSNYIASVLEKGLASMGDEGRLDSQIKLVNKIVGAIVEATGEASFDGLSVNERAELLLSLVDKHDTIYALDKRADIPRPETSISQSSLFTGAVHEPSMMTELKKEIASADRIDLLVSFIKWSGLRLIMNELSNFTKRGGKLRIITTSYMGATDVKAIEELFRLINTDIKISYDTKRTRLHAKTYIFYRETGFSTAYVGSSNLSNAAISSGLEWNVKVTAQDLPETIRKITATFESYWNSDEFEDYGEQGADRLRRALRSERLYGEKHQLMLFDITPYPFQQEILDKLTAERSIRGSF